MHPSILFSSPRCEDAYIYCTLPNGIRVLFDTGTGNAALPRNLIQECQETGMKMMPIPIDVTKGYIDGHKAHYNLGMQSLIEFSKDLILSVGLVVEPDMTDRKPYIRFGLPLIERYVLCYDRQNIELRDQAPDDYDLKIPLTFREGKYYLNATVNGFVHEFVLDTGLGNGIEMPIADTCHIISEHCNFEETYYVSGNEFHDFGF